MLELFSLTEAELVRVPKDRKVFQQQVHFEFRTSPENLEKANKLSDLILRQSVPLQDDATALYAAVKEGIDNAFVHGNNRQTDKTIDVNFLVDRKKITVTIEDEGEGFDYEYYLSRLDDEEAFEKAKRRILDEGVRGRAGISSHVQVLGPSRVLRIREHAPPGEEHSMGSAAGDGDRRLEPASLTEARERLRRKLAACIRTGKITLSSGKETDFYFDGRLVSARSGGIGADRGALPRRGPEARDQGVGGLTSGADPITSAIGVLAHQRSVPLKLFYVRKAAKDHGMQKRIEGPRSRPA